MVLETLISFVLATTILAISPGPDNIFVLTQSLVNGAKAGLATVFGLMLGCLFHTTLVAFGVSEIIKQHENLFFLIKLFGASYLLYLSYKVYTKESQIIFSTKNIIKRSSLELFWKGFLMNVLNPKVTIFFFAFFPQFLFSNDLSEIFQFYVLGILFIIVSFIVFGLIAFLGGTISNYLATNKNIGLYLKWSQIIVFVSISIFIIL
ncbi:MAG: Homoserine/homoserine lactone efflux protein [Polaribacter sp. SA4-10]|nr:MAG: Homoserine/homoserine lactone efflux protein [Polaribacter sp. SA4-10]|tara:strand:- start:933 stop:1550 length:618 start_codon:yes stop_codon:yes gene_type:complete